MQSRVHHQYKAFPVRQKAYAAFQQMFCPHLHICCTGQVQLQKVHRPLTHRAMVVVLQDDARRVVTQQELPQLHVCRGLGGKIPVRHVQAGFACSWDLQSFIVMNPRRGIYMSLLCIGWHWMIELG